MLRVLLTLALAVNTASASALSANEPIHSNVLKKRRNTKHGMAIRKRTNTELQLIQLPAASHDDLMSLIRAHPTWFVHMNFDGEHTITKLPPAGNAGDTALNLLQLHIGMELGTRDENGMMEETQLHELDWSSLTDADKANVERIPSKVNVDTSATKGKKACPARSFIKTATFDEVDKTKVEVNPVCAKCAPHCEVCIGEGMDLCMKCAPEEGQETFLVRLVDDPDVCLTKEKCRSAGKKIDGVFCEDDYENTGGKVATDDEIFEMAMEDEENADLHTLPIANSIMQANGKKTMKKKMFKKKLHTLHEKEKQSYKKMQKLEEKETVSDESQEQESSPTSNSDSNQYKLEQMSGKLEGMNSVMSGLQKQMNKAEKQIDNMKKENFEDGEDGEDDEADEADEAYEDNENNEDDEDDEAELMQTNLLEIKSKLQTSMKSAAEQEVGIPVIDDVCEVYKKGWTNNADVHKYLGGIIFGYNEGEDAKLKGALGSQTSFKKMYDTALAAPAAHEMGWGKKIAMVVDAEKSNAAAGDSFWCQSMAIVEGLEAKIDDDSKLKKFLNIAKKVVDFLQRTIGGNDLIKRLFGLIKDVFNWINKMRKKWADRLAKIQEHKGYKQGISKMCDFSVRVRTFLSKMQSMCFVNEVMNKGGCQAKQLMNNVANDVRQITQAKMQQKSNQVKAFAKAMDDKKSETNAANAAEKLSPLENTFAFMGKALKLANTVREKVDPLWNFLEKDHRIKFGCACVPVPAYGRRRRWSGLYWGSPKCGCIINDTVNIMNLFRRFSNILNKCLDFLKGMFQPLINFVNAKIDKLKREALDWLTRKFNNAFNLDEMLVIPKLMSGFQNKIGDYKQKFQKALPITAMVKGFQEAKKGVLAMSAKDKRNCKKNHQDSSSSSGSSARLCTGKADMYQHNIGGGWKARFEKGNYNIGQMTRKGMRNDDMTSMVVPAGCRVTIYQDGSFNGWKLSVGPGRYMHADLMREGKKQGVPNFNDQASSLKVKDEDVQTIMIKGHHKCLDAAQRNSNGGKVHMWDCNSGNANQFWEYNKKTGQIKSEYGKCLDHGANYKNGGKVHMWNCDSGNVKANRQWKVTKLSSGKFRITPRNNNHVCLDGAHHGSNGGKVHLWSCTSQGTRGRDEHHNRKFTIQEI